MIGFKISRKGSNLIRPSEGRTGVQDLLYFFLSQKKCRGGALGSPDELSSTGKKANHVNNDNSENAHRHEQLKQGEAGG